MQSFFRGGQRCSHSASRFTMQLPRERHFTTRQHPSAVHPHHHAILSTVATSIIRQVHQNSSPKHQQQQQQQPCEHDETLGSNAQHQQPQRQIAEEITTTTATTATTTTRSELGFQFEHDTVHILNDVYGFHVRNTTKQSHDQGVDFYGTWTVSHHHRTVVHILGQCKRESKPISVRHLRELQGTLSQFNNNNTHMNSHSQVQQLLESGDSGTGSGGSHNKRYVGMLVSDRLGFSIHATRFAQQCTDGVILCTLDPVNRHLVHFVMNDAARRVIGPQLVTATERDNNGSKYIQFYETVHVNDGDAMTTTAVRMIPLSNHVRN